LVTEVTHSQEGPVKMVGPMARYGGTPLPPSRPSPALGEHSREILEWLGIDRASIDDWRDAGAVG
jgi:crotonobetainyl-CoA:carnitine CoA-transferase CaiB-like acyl-CoA transferase